MPQTLTLKSPTHQNHLSCFLCFTESAFIFLSSSFFLETKPGLRRNNSNNKNIQNSNNTNSLSSSFVRPALKLRLTNNLKNLSLIFLECNNKQQLLKYFLLMDKALGCHTCSWCSNPDKTKDIFFLFGKIQTCAPIPSGAPPCALSILMAHSQVNSGLTCYGGDKERVTQNNPSSAICGGKTQMKVRCL